jgi:hypothetical protein
VFYFLVEWAEKNVVNVPRTQNWHKFSSLKITGRCMNQTIKLIS